MKRSLLLPTMFSWAIILLAGCGGDRSSSPEPGPHLQYLVTVDHRCQGHKDGLAFEPACDLTSASYRGDTLRIVFRFMDQCCARFRTDARWNEGALSIAVRDTARAQCDCICNFDEEFLFHCTLQGDLRVRFSGGGCGIDTVLQLDRIHAIRDR
jgi:hypothetical protein